MTVKTSGEAAQQRLSSNSNPPSSNGGGGEAAVHEAALPISQRMAGGGAANESSPVRVADASLISSLAPPIGRDPNTHHHDVAANLQAVKQALLSPGSALPRILMAPTDSTGSAGLPLGLPAGSVHSTASVANPPPSFAGLGRSTGPGVSEIKSNRLQR